MDFNQHGIHSPNRLKLGIFCYNVEGGVALTTVPERWGASWADMLAAVQMAEQYGLEFALPVARWRGYGADNRRGKCFETMSQSAALAGLTRRITLFSTIHVPLVHPLLAAKFLTTVDHVSGGRAALNIVAGWNQEEFDMFGLVQEDHVDRYQQAREWSMLFNRLISGGAPFDHDGRYYRGRGMVAEPGTLQPRLPTLNAAFSPAGRDFAAEVSDYLFTLVTSPEQIRRDMESVAAKSAMVGRPLGMMTTCYIVCRATRQEAEAYHQHYAATMADTALLDRTLASKTKQARHHFTEGEPVSAEEQLRLDRVRLHYAGGNGSHPVVGSPQDVAEQLIELCRMGFAGTTLSFVNFTAELPFFCESVLPILQSAGLRA
jgi:alkanesulfonate monooxygenase SsuD/methylene tetrahydromethanopterin reductase-like flavin-dependent oxidoreductase (luciferase family)